MIADIGGRSIENESAYTTPEPAQENEMRAEPKKRKMESVNGIGWECCHASTSPSYASAGQVRDPDRQRWIQGARKISSMEKTEPWFPAKIGTEKPIPILGFDERIQRKSVS